MPPVTTTSCRPARIIRSASSIARIDEAQTLLIVSAGTSFGMPAPTAACRAGAWPDAGLEHLAHDDVADLGGIDARALEACPDRDRAELGRRVPGETAAEPAERRPHRRDDHRARHGASVPPSPSDTRRRLFSAGTTSVRRSSDRSVRLDQPGGVVDVRQLHDLAGRVHVAKRDADDPGRDPVTGDEHIVGVGVRGPARLDRHRDAGPRGDLEQRVADDSD